MLKTTMQSARKVGVANLTRAMTSTAANETNYNILGDSELVSKINAREISVHKLESSIDNQRAAFIRRAVLFSDGNSTTPAAWTEPLEDAATDAMVMAQLLSGEAKPHNLEQLVEPQTAAILRRRFLVGDTSAPAAKALPTVEVSRSSQSRMRLTIDTASTMMMGASSPSPKMMGARAFSTWAFAPLSPAKKATPQVNPNNLVDISLAASMGADDAHLTNLSNPSRQDRMAMNLAWARNKQAVHRTLVDVIAAAEHGADDGVLQTCSSLRGFASVAAPEESVDAEAMMNATKAAFGGFEY